MTYIYYTYLVVSAAGILVLDKFLPILRQSYSLWAMPLIFIGIYLSLVIIQALLFVCTIQFTNLNKPMTAKRSRFFRAQLKCALPLIVGVARVKIKASGTEKLPKDKRFLLVCNHQHDFDPVIIMATFPECELAYIGKKEIYTEMRFVAKAMHLMQSLPIDRENDREAAKTIIKASKLIKEDVASVVLFPEGYTNLTPENGMLPFRNGAFKIAMKANAPIVVCVVNNTRQIPKNIILRRTYVDFRILDVITPEAYNEMNTQQLGDLIHEKMEKELEIIRK